MLGFHKMRFKETKFQNKEKQEETAQQAMFTGVDEVLLTSLK